MNSGPSQAFLQSLRSEPAGWAISNEGAATVSLFLTPLMLMLLVLYVHILDSGLCTTIQNVILAFKGIALLSSSQKQAEA